jgi:hypothetical protein
MSSLDSGLGQKPDGTPIRGREVVRLICSDCGSAVIGKVMADKDWRVWINAYSKPRGDYGSTRGAKRVAAPRTTRSSLLQSAGHPDVVLWCETHGERVASKANLYQEIERGKKRGRPARMVV